RPAIPETPSTWCYLSPKGWLSGAATNGCCSCINWARHNLFPPGTDYAAMEAGVSDPEDTPVFLPFLFGERCPGWNSQRRGGFVDCQSRHNIADLYLAVQEGVLFNLYQCYTILTKIGGTPREIKLSGGILNSPRWLQMCADIFGCTMTLDNAIHGSLLGACVVAMEKLGVIGDLRDFSPQSNGTVEPDPEKAVLYQKKFQRYLDYYDLE
ncbi:MAG: FGGY-family carbohydrate kinase, partial [Oscillospiraceae bacterium]